jgi:hypothetical protein
MLFATKTRSHQENQNKKGCLGVLVPWWQILFFVPEPKSSASGIQDFLRVLCVSGKTRFFAGNGRRALRAALTLPGRYVTNTAQFFCKTFF